MVHDVENLILCHVVIWNSEDASIEADGISGGVLCYAKIQIKTKGIVL